jgi:serine protease Do
MSKFYDNNFGALITAVEENTPAAKAGLKRGDLIISVNGKKIQSALDLKNKIGSFAPSRVVNIKFLRNKKIDIVNVKLASLDSIVVAGTLKYKGMELETLSPAYKQQLGKGISGVIVTNVNIQSEAYKVGVRKGDIIIQIENIEISTIDDFKEATASKDRKRVFIYRGGSIYAVVL